MQNCLISGKTIITILFLLGSSSLSAQDYNYPYNPQKLNSIISILEKVQSDTATWDQLKKRYFSRSRNSSVIFVTYRTEKNKLQAKIQELAIDTLTVSIRDILYKEEPVQTHNLYIKSNIIGLTGAIVNASAEVDILPHLSFALPVYYSAWNYFKTTIKLRTLHIQPEIRYWLNESNDRLFIGAHFGYGSYNVAMNGEYRYQDHNRKTPAIGGGLAIGYRMPININSRWNLEVSLGYGAYKLHYDIFQNTPVTKKGLKTGEIKKTYIGFDQAAISISYLLPERKKGGRK